MSNDKYGADQAPDCYPGSDVLINLLDLRTADDLDEAERYINELAAAKLEFIPPPYSLATLKDVHRTLFDKIYSLAGEIRTLAISKGSTRFCSPEFIEREIAKEFSKMADAGWFEDYSRDHLIHSVAQMYGNINVAHPFREGNADGPSVLSLNTSFTTQVIRSIGIRWIAKGGLTPAFTPSTELSNLLSIYLITASACR